MRIPAGLIAIGLLASPLHAQTSFTGPTEAIDGDSLAAGGIEVRLFGIDAPEGKQKCSRDGHAWPCGEAAAGKLPSLVEGQTVSCRARGQDTYGRAVSVCSAGGIELNRTMVAQGWATAFRAVPNTTLRTKCEPRPHAWVFGIPLSICQPISAVRMKSGRPQRRRRCG